MAAKRKKSSKRISLVGEIRDPATPETLKKLRPDPIWKMAEALGSEGLQAAHEIRDAVNIIAAPVRIRLQKWERQDPSFSENEAERAVRLQYRYNSWVDRMTDRKLPVGPALDMIVEGLGCREIEEIRQWRHGSVRPYFIDAMVLYCELAGWKRSTSSRR